MGFDRGYLKLRRGIKDHIRRGFISKMETLAFILMALDADPRTGVWWGSAKAMAGEFTFEERTARMALESLEKKGYIKRFTRQGRHGNYAILVNNYECTDGVNEGMVLSAADTTDCEAPVYKPRDERGDVRVDVNGDVRVNVSSPYKEIEEEEEEEIHDAGNPPASPVSGSLFPNSEPPSDPRDDTPSKRLLSRIGREVFDYYLMAMGRDGAVYFYSEDVRRHMRARAKEALGIARDKGIPGSERAAVAILGMKTCVDAIKKSPWHMGENPSSREYNDIENIFGSSKKFRNWLHFKPKG